MSKEEKALSPEEKRKRVAEVMIRKGIEKIIDEELRKQAKRIIFVLEGWIKRELHKIKQDLSFRKSEIGALRESRKEIVKDIKALKKRLGKLESAKNTPTKRHSIH